MTRWGRTCEAAELLRQSTSRVRDMIRAGHLVEGVHYVKRPGIGYRFKLDALDRWLDGDVPQVPQRQRGRQGCKADLSQVA